MGAWTTTWSEERWKENADKARAKRNIEPGGPSTGTAHHTSGSKSMVEHALDLERELARPLTSMEVFVRTHKKKDGTFVDSRSAAIYAEMSERVAQASQHAVEGEKSQSLSTEALNDIYYDVGGRTKNSTIYGLGSQARVAFDDRLRAPRGRSSYRSAYSSEMHRMLEENRDLRSQVQSVQGQMAQWMTAENERRAADEAARATEGARRDEENQQFIAENRELISRMRFLLDSLPRPPSQDTPGPSHPPTD